MTKLCLTFRYLGELNSMQESVLQQFKEWIQENQFPHNPWYNDTIYLRFCRARKFDLEKVKLMWQNYLEYRSEMGIDDIVTVSEPPYDALKLLLFLCSVSNSPSEHSCSRTISEATMESTRREGRCILSVRASITLLKYLKSAQTRSSGRRSARATRRS